MDNTQRGFKNGVQKPRTGANCVFHKVRSHKESRDGSKKTKKAKKVAISSFLRFLLPFVFFASSFIPIKEADCGKVF
jgi:hypothetical protein